MKKFLAAITNPVTGDFGNFNKVAANPLAPFFVKVWRAVIIFGAILMLVYLLWGSIEWLTSEGDKEKLTSARNKILHAIVGMSLLAASVAIVFFIDNLGIFGFKILQLEWPTP